MKIFDDTKTMNAHFLLDDQGNEQTREEMLEQIAREDPVWMLYVGGGYMPLKVAIGALTMQDAVEGFEEWARDNDRLDEIGEDVECEKCKTRACLDTRDNVGMYATWMRWSGDLDENDVYIWKCPECSWRCSQPEHYGEYELSAIQQVPQDILKGAVTLRRSWPDTLCVWNRGLTELGTEDNGPDRLIKGKVIEKIEGLLSIQESVPFGHTSPMKDWVSWPVITDNEKVLALVPQATKERSDDGNN